MDKHIYNKFMYKLYKAPQAVKDGYNNLKAVGDQTSIASFVQQMLEAHDKNQKKLNAEIPQSLPDDNERNR